MDGIVFAFSCNSIELFSKKYTANVLMKIVVRSIWIIFLLLLLLHYLRGAETYSNKHVLIHGCALQFSFITIDYFSDGEIIRGG